MQRRIEGQVRQAVFIGMAMIFALGVAGIFSPAQAADRVGYINLSQLVRDSAMGKKAQAELTALRQKKEKEIEVKGNTFKQLREEFNTRGAQMAEAEKKEKAELLQDVAKDYQRMVADAKEDIARQDRELVARILKEADGILKDVAKKKKFGIILKDPNAVGYLDPEVDITNDVLAELNKKK